MYTIEIEKRCLRELKQLEKSIVRRAFDSIFLTKFTRLPYKIVKVPVLRKESKGSAHEPWIQAPGPLKVSKKK